MQRALRADCPSVSWGGPGCGGGGGAQRAHLPRHELMGFFAPPVDATAPAPAVVMKFVGHANPEHSCRQWK